MAPYFHTMQQCNIQSYRTLLPKSQYRRYKPYYAAVVGFTESHS
jgi:hypothetical protein